MIQYAKHGLRMAESWLDEPIVAADHCDVLLLQQYRRAPEPAVTLPFHSLTLDLRRSEDELMKGLERGTRYEVLRAQNKDALSCAHELLCDDEACRRFSLYYDEFAAAKAVAPLRAGELWGRVRAGMLWSSRVMLGDEVLSWHVHVATADRVSLLHSASQFRQMEDSTRRALVGRANRLLHWKDILWFRASGRSQYDFGGWYAGSEDQALLGINRFKEAFGGQRVDQVNAAIPLTWRGRLYLVLRQQFSARQRKDLSRRIQAMFTR